MYLTQLSSPSHLFFLLVFLLSLSPLPLSEASLMDCADKYDVASGELIQGGYGDTIGDG